MTRPAVGQGVGSGVGGPAAGRKVDRVRWPSMIGPVPRKPTGRPPGRPRGPERAKILVRLDPRQEVAIRRLAVAAQRKRNLPQPDMSAVIRELLDKALRLKAPTAE